MGNFPLTWDNCKNKRRKLLTIVMKSFSASLSLGMVGFEEGTPVSAGGGFIQVTNTNTQLCRYTDVQIYRVFFNCPKSC